MFTWVSRHPVLRGFPSGRGVMAKRNISYRVKLLRTCVLGRGVVLMNQRCDEGLGEGWSEL